MTIKGLAEQLLVFYGRHFPIDKGKLRIIDKFWSKACVSPRHERTARLRYGNYFVGCDLKELIQRQIYFFGDYLHERPLLDLWCQYSRSSTTIFDVGANVGVYSLAAAWASPASQIHAFEPTPEIAAALDATLVRNDIESVYVNRTAISNREGKARLVRRRGELGSNGGMNVLADPSHEEEEGLISTTTLDAYCEARGILEIDLLKLDVEGHEYRALFGARGLISQQRIKVVFLELNWFADEGLRSPAEQSVHFLHQAGYVFANPRGKFCFRPLGGWMYALSDVVAVPAGRAQRNV